MYAGNATKLYDVTAFNCTCGDTQYRGRAVVCKHRAGLEEVGLLTVAGSA